MFASRVKLGQMGCFVTTYQLPLSNCQIMFLGHSKEDTASCTAYFISTLHHPSDQAAALFRSVFQDYSGQPISSRSLSSPCVC